MPSDSPLKALTLVCTLKRSPEKSSADKLAHDLASEFEKQGVEMEFIRLVDHVIKPGVELDMKNGDEWPKIRRKIMGGRHFDIRYSNVGRTDVQRGAPSD